MSIREDSKYKDDILIDEHNLEGEWEAQSGLYMKWAEEHANAIFERDKKKVNLDIVYSKEDERVRNDAESENIRLTEAMIKARVLQSPKYSRAMDEYLEATKTANIMQAAKESMHSRRKALENLTQLFLGGYYSVPNIPAEAKKKSSIETEKTLSKKLKRNKRLTKRVRK